MLTIANENTQQIRTPFEVHCTLVSRDDIELDTSIPSFAGVKLSDSNLYQMLANDSVEMRRLADLSNGGFRADGSASFFDGNRQGSEAAGKLGIRTKLGDSVQVDITSAKVINSLTITTTEGDGEVLDLNSFHSVGTDTSKAYTKQVPTGANYTRLQKILGESVVSKNLIEPSFTNGTSGGITFVLNADKSITASGTRTDPTAYLVYEGIIESGTYTLGVAKGSISNIRGDVTINGVAIDNGASVFPTTFTVSTKSTIRISLKGSGNGSAVSGTGYFQLEKGTSLTSYEPHFDGIIDATPTNVTSVGKNIFDVASSEIGKACNNATNSARAINRIELEVGKTYTISGSNGNCDGVYRGFMDNVGAFPTGVGQVTFPYTFTATTGAILLAFNKTNIAIEDIKSCNIQVERSNVATQYSPYTSTSLNVNYGTLRSAGNVHDELDLVNGKIIRRVGQVDLGSLSWTYDSSNARFGTSFFGVLDIKERETRKYPFTCGKYEPLSNGEAWADVQPRDKVVYATPTSGGQLYIHDHSYTTASAFKQAMQGVLLNYELATPYEEPIQVTTNLLEVEPNGSITFENAGNTYGLNIPLTSTVEYGSVRSYPIRQLIVIPVNAQSISLLFKPNANTRLSIASIIAGLTLEFDNENLISCNLALRSDLNIIEPKLEVSEIEINAYYPLDIAEVISNVGDNTPITYYAGYPGDYSESRTFYLAEKATQQDNVIKIKGVDAADRLDSYTFPYKAIQAQNNTAAADIYARLVTAVEAALGREIKVNKQVTPENYGLDTTMHFLVWHEMTARDMISTIMNLCRLETDTEDFWPVFVDAGIPTISWSKPVAKWDIYEEDCAEIEEAWDRNINRIISDEGDYGLITDLTVKGNAQIDDVSVEPNQINSYNFEGYVYQPSVSNYRSIVQATAKAITWIAAGAANSKLYGRRIDVRTIAEAAAANRLGATATVKPLVTGRLFHRDNNTVIFPNYSKLFEISNGSGSFKFKGDPRMQPRDVFRFHRLDGTIEECTIETINIEHVGGGTVSDVTYRKGVV